jgi:hypothetical protein
VLDGRWLAGWLRVLDTDGLPLAALCFAVAGRTQTQCVGFGSRPYRLYCNIQCMDAVRYAPNIFGDGLVTNSLVPEP